MTVSLPFALRACAAWTLAENHAGRQADRYHRQGLDGQARYWMREAERCGAQAVALLAMLESETEAVA
jgi:hypothetical protein